MDRPQDPNKGRQPIATTPRNYRQLHGSERRPTPDARVLGPADEAERFNVTIVLNRRADGPPIPGHDYFLHTPPSERPRLSEAEFAARYGADPAAIDNVTAFARAQGLTVDATNVARRTVAQYNRAFDIKLQLYEREVERGPHPGKKTEIYRGRDGYVHVPADLVDIILGVFGLDNRRITKRGLADPPATTLLTMPTITQLYDFPPNLAAGQTIAVFSEAGYLPSDISANFGGSPPSVIDVTVDASNGLFPDLETTQDIFIAASAAPGAQIAVYFTTYSQVGWVDLLTRVIHPSPGDPQCSVLTTSFYVSNGDDAAALLASGVSISWVTAVTQMLQDAAIQGVSFCTCSGDNGTDARVGDGQAHVWYPATDPWALACGGTTIGSVSGTTCDEWAWADTFTFGGSTLSGASGGGVSDYFPQPWYQSDTSIPVSIKDGHVGRGVPDVATNASPNSGCSIILGGTPSAWPTNGTSASAPLWAGLIAALNAALGQNVGFINPVIYALNGAGFRDILPEPGASNNAFAGVPGYPVVRIGTSR